MNASSLKKCKLLREIRYGHLTSRCPGPRDLAELTGEVVEETEFWGCEGGRCGGKDGEVEGEGITLGSLLTYSKNIR